MAFKTASKDVRNLFLQCLQVDDLCDRFFTTQNIADICNHAAGVESEKGIDANAGGRAFSYSAMDGDRYYSLHFNEVAMIASTNAGRLCGYIGRRFERGAKCVTIVGRFTSVEKEAAALDRVLSAESTDRLALRQWDFSSIDDEIVDAFRSHAKSKTYLYNQMTIVQSHNKRSRKQHAPRRVKRRRD